MTLIIPSSRGTKRSAIRQSYVTSHTPLNKNSAIQLRNNRLLLSCLLRNDVNNTVIVRNEAICYSVAAHHIARSTPFENLSYTTSINRLLLSYLHCNDKEESS